MMDDYVEFDRQLDAQTSLDHFCSCLEKTSTDDTSWKYAIISLHNALQGYMCIGLMEGNDFQTWSKRDLNKWLKAYYSNSELPDPKLDFFMALYDKTFKNEPSLDRKNIEELNYLRNRLLHFNTDSHLIHKKSAVIYCKEALKAIKLAPSKAMGIFFYTDDQQETYHQLCGRAELLLTSL